MARTDVGASPLGEASARVSDRAGLALPLIAALVVVAWLVLAPRADALVYWGNGTSEDGSIGRAHQDGTNVQQDFITGVSEPCGVAVDSGHIYWADFQGDRIGRADITGTGVDHDFITGVVDPCGIAVDSGHIYWSTCSSTGAIGRADLDGTGVDQDFIPATATDGPCGVGVDADHVYWANCETPGSIGRANINGTDPSQTFITGTDQPCGEIAVNSSFIYWTNSGTVARAEIDGDPADQDFIIGVSNGFGVAADATHLYWINFGVGGVGQAIGRATLGGGNLQQDFITAVDGPEGIAVDSLTSFPLVPNDFSFGKLKRNKKKGTATLSVEVPNPGSVELAGKGIKAKEASGAGDVKLKVRSKGGKKRKLEEAGKVKVKAKVTYTPTGGEPNTQSKRIKLVKAL